ncbi:MAG: endolytic transglycosylase MltG [Bacteroidia bacterium]|jgi:UPF0755 protein
MHIKERKLIFRTLLTVGTILLISAGIKLYEDVFASNIVSGKKEVICYIYTQKSFEQNMESLREQGVLKNPGALSRLFSITGYGDLLRPGRYVVNASASNLDLMRLFVSGRQQSIDIVFTGGERVHDVAVFWSKFLEADSNAIEAAVYAQVPADALGLNAENVIQVFVPNTYNFFWNTNAEKFLKRMILEYRLFWDSTRLAKSQYLKMTPLEVGILASIVQKETSKQSEMPTVAGVYRNRLLRGMPLQADPTLIFALNDKSIRRVGGEMLQLESPYNTYKYTGLPPGPLCVPSVQAIDAVLNAEKHAYLYFCAKEDFSGYHNFAASFAQHQLNARKYQRALNRKGIK